MEREQIVKALEYCTKEEDCVGCPYLIRRGDGTILPCQVDADALALIKELADENESLTKTVKVRGETIEKLQFSVTDISEDNRKLTEKNEGLIAEMTHLELHREADIKAFKALKADTVRKMQERLHERFGDRAAYTASHCHEAIDRIAEEMLEGEK